MTTVHTNLVLENVAVIVTNKPRRVVKPKSLLLKKKILSTIPDLGGNNE
jgi:hypothetical protein